MARKGPGPLIGSFRLIARIRATIRFRFQPDCGAVLQWLFACIHIEGNPVISSEGESCAVKLVKQDF